MLTITEIIATHSALTIKDKADAKLIIVNAKLALLKISDQGAQLSSGQCAKLAAEVLEYLK